MLFRLDSLGEHCVEVLAFRKVRNTQQLINNLRDGTFAAALVKASMVGSIYPLLVATLHAIEKESRKAMITRCVETEILYNLSSSRNISTALKQFGVQDDTSDMIVLIVNGNKEKIEKVGKYIQGEEMNDVEMMIKKLSDEVELRKVYDIKEMELKCSSLEDSILSRMACKQIK